MKEKKRNVSVTVIVFCAVLLAGLLAIILHPAKTYSDVEKRYLTQFPTVSLQSVANGSFEEGVEDYLSDQFPLRNFFVGCFSYYTLLTGDNGANGVYYGKDGFLINEPVRPEDSSLETNVSILASLAETTGLPTVLVAVPSTGYIYGEELPALHETYQDDLYFQQISQTVQGTMSVIDLRATFLEEKETSLLYYHTDHHWTTYGAWLCYLALCEEMDLDAVPVEDIAVETVEGFKGTTSSTSGFYLVQADDIEIWHVPSVDDAVHMEIWEGSDCTESDSLYFMDQAQGSDKYALFLDGNHSLQYVYNETASGGTLLLIQDSFAHCLTPFLAYDYQKIVVVDPRYYKASISELAEEEGAEEILIVYSLDNLCTDTDIPWVR